MDRKRPREEHAIQVRRRQPTGERLPKYAKRTYYPNIQSTLFQVPLEKRDLDSFRTPMNQQVENPMNCGAVSTQLLHIIPKAVVEQLSKENTPTSVDQWVSYMNKRTPTKTEYYSDSTRDIAHAFDVLQTQLFEGFATLVGITRVSPEGEMLLGHFFVVVKLRPGNFYLLDPQIRMGTDANGIMKYLEEQQLNGEVVVIATNEPQTRGDFQTDYIDRFLPDLLTTECSIKGGRKKRRMTRRRKTGRK